MKINLALSGANGRMGKEIAHAVNKDVSFDLILKLTKDNYNEYKYNQDQLLGNLSENLNNITVFIDFSTPASCLEYAKICNQSKIPMVIGTTGFSDFETQKITDLAKSSPILLSPNMSLGANICKYLIGSLSKLWSEHHIKETLIEIKETHHKHKKDQPSGTALSMADLINKNFLAKQKVPINFISKRIGEVKGEHQVTFSNIFEEIIIKHNVLDRSIFAYGALLAAKWLVQYKINHSTNQPYELYNFFHVMDLGFHKIAF